MDRATNPVTHYHAAPGLSGTGIRHLLRSPAHYRAVMDAPREATPAMILGSAVHAAVLEPGKLDAEFAVAPTVDRRTKAGKEAYEAFVAEAGGRDILTAEQWETVQRIRDAATEHPAVQELLHGAICERPLFWTDREHGIQCKGKPDAAASDWSHLIDLKTTDDARAQSFQRGLVKFGYHVQLAHYVSGVLHQEDVEPLRIFFIVVETEPPHGIRTYSLEPGAIHRARLELERAYRLYADCTRSGNWPVYGYEIEEITLPAWAA